MQESNTYMDKFRENFKQIREDTREENTLQIVLRGHLYLENIIESMLKDTLEKPNEILGDRFMFMSKLNLAVAMGLISKEISNPLKYFNNKIRNRYAHNLKFELSDEIFDEWVSKFDAKTKDKYDKGLFLSKNSGLDTDKLIEKLRVAVWSLWNTVMTCYVDCAVKPLEEELVVLARLADFRFKSEDEQKEYLEVHLKEVRQKIKEIGSSIE